MQRLNIAFGIGCLMLTALTGCGPSADELAAKADEEHRQLLEQFEQQHQTLDVKRQELADLRARLEQAPEEGAAEAVSDETTDGAAAGEDLKAQIESLQAEISQASDDFYAAIGTFLNDEVPMLQGEPPTEIQKSALRMKSDEDMILAREYIVEGGDYKRAITIYEQALAVDPDNTALQEALAEAQANRFMTEERFAAVKNGMTEAEVQEVLGRPLHYNVRDYEQKGQTITAWYYSKNEQGAAAAVWFRPQRGNMIVYRANFNEVAGQGEGESES